MNVFMPDYKYVIHPNKGIQLTLDENLDKFNVDLLNIGDLQAPSEPSEVLAVVFDLEGFTDFTRQVDPQLAIPNFISEFFSWLFTNIKECMIDKQQGNVLWAELPFFSKFTGDGVLFLWKIDMKKIIGIDSKLSSKKLQDHLQRFLCNIVASLYNFCKRYPVFLKSIKGRYVDPPRQLRCGIARGNVFPIGAGKDYVGPCINIASRLQKFNGLSFVFSARGIDKRGFNIDFEEVFVEKQVGIRGIGTHELVYVVKDEFAGLPEELKANFYEV
ncbi:MAG: hypothetical protein GF401_20625 [Chitinivibrionales bacterium]|nr:hypothetical protein [Chitinivibrionales bacterium]